MQKVSFPQEEIRLCLLGDTGTNRDTQQRVARLLEKENCSTVHFLGDLIYPDGLSSYDDPQLQDKFLQHYGNLPRPLYLIMGNHDHRGSLTPWKELHRRGVVYFPEHHYLLKFNDLCLINLDSNLTKLPLLWHKALSQSLWLSALDLSGCAQSVVLSHHPYQSRGKHGPASGLLRFLYWLQVVDKFDYLITAHEHILSDEGSAGKTRLLISGGGGDPDEGEKAGYLVLFVSRVGGKTSVRHEFRYVDELAQSSSN